MEEYYIPKFYTVEEALLLVQANGVAHKKVGICVFLCMEIHTLMDLTAGISLVLPQNVAYPVIYMVLTVMAVVSVVILKNIRRHWTE